MVPVTGEAEAGVVTHSCVVTVTGEAEAVGLVEPGSLRPAWASSSHVTWAVLQITCFSSDFLMLGYGLTSRRVLSSKCGTLGLMSNSTEQTAVSNFPL